MWSRLYSFIQGKKPRQSKGRVCLSMDQNGIAVAHFALDSQRLQLVRFLPCTPPNQYKTLSQFVQSHHLKHCDCTYVLSPTEYQTHIIDKPAVLDDEVKDAARWEMKDLIDMPIDDVVLDYFPLPIESEQPPRIAVVTSPLEHIRTLVSKLTHAKLHTQMITITELSLAALCAQLPTDPYGTILLFMAGDSMHLLIVHHQKMYLARQLMNSGDFLNHEKFVSKNDNTRSLYEKTTLEIQRSLDFYQGHMEQSMPAKLFVSPQLAQDESWIQWLQQHLNLPVERLDLNTVLPVSQQLDMTTQIQCCTVIGAGLHHALLNNVPASEEGHCS